MELILKKNVYLVVYGVETYAFWIKFWNNAIDLYTITVFNTTIDIILLSLLHDKYIIYYKLELQLWIISIIMDMLLMYLGIVVY